jgi:hypothetical protein
MGKYLLNLPDDDLERLRNLSASTGLPVAACVREAVRSWLGQETPCGVQMSGGQIVSGTAMLVRVQ